MKYVEVESIGSATGVHVRLQNADFLLILGSKGYIMCGYLNMATAEKKGDAAAMVTGVASFEDVLTAKVTCVSSKGKELGIREGMTGKAALAILS
jgi:uncharacterized protein YunC (DUF1805 family)